MDRRLDPLPVIPLPRCIAYDRVGVAVAVNEDNAGQLVGLDEVL